MSNKYMNKKPSTDRTMWSKDMEQKKSSELLRDESMKTATLKSK